MLSNEIKANQSNALLQIDLSIQDRLSHLAHNPTPEGWVVTEDEELEWPHRLDKWRLHWNAVKTHVENNAPQLLFSKNPSIRRQQYQNCLHHLHEAFVSLAKENRDYSLFETSLPELPTVCYTGWQERVCQLQEQARLSSLNEEIDLHSLADNGAYLLRRDLWLNQILPSLVSPELATNVHYQKMTKQWANDLYDLRYSAEELGDKEEYLLSLYSPLLIKQGAALFQKHYTEATLLEQLQYLYPSNKNFLQPLIDDQINKMQKGLIPYLDAQIPLQKLYSDLKKIQKISSYELFVQELKSLHHRFIKEGYKPPFSALTLTEQAKSYLMTSPIQLAVLQGKDLRVVLAKKDFLSTIEKEKILVRIMQLEQGESPSLQEIYLQDKKKEIAHLLDNLSQKILDHNSLLLQRKVADETGALLPYGARLWAEAAGLFPPKFYQLPQEALRFYLPQSICIKSALSSPVGITHIPSLFLYHSCPSNSLPKRSIAKKKQQWLMRLAHYYKTKKKPYRSKPVGLSQLYSKEEITILRIFVDPA